RCARRPGPPRRVRQYACSTAAAGAAAADPAGAEPCLTEPAPSIPSCPARSEKETRAFRMQPSEQGGPSRRRRASLTPDRVRTTVFSRSSLARRGYDVDEVQLF